METINEREAEYKKRKRAIEIKMMAGPVIPLIIMVIFIRFYFKFVNSGQMNSNTGLILAVCCPLLLIMQVMLGFSTREIILNQVAYSRAYMGEIIDIVKSSQGFGGYTVTYRFQNADGEWLEKKGMIEEKLPKGENADALIGRSKKIWYEPFCSDYVVSLGTKEELDKHIFSGMMLLRMVVLAVGTVGGIIYAVMMGM